MEKNIKVTDVNGKELGLTYPKRAKGLIKNGRAQYVDDCTIRLSDVSPDLLSEAKQMNYIFLNPRNWSEKDGVERTFIDGFEGSLEEILQIGSWTTECKAESKHFLLNPDAEYSFVFWLNGGENEGGREICDLIIRFNLENGFANRYKLNRSYIKPLLHFRGWELYSIGFTTPEASEAVDVNFTFHVKNAPMAVKAAKEPEYYSEWKDEIDEFASQRPQRHNIVFEDGWPSIHMQGGNRYSTEVLRAKKSSTEDSKKSKQSRIKDALSSFGINFEYSESGDDESDVLENLSEKFEDIQDDFEEISDDIEDYFSTFEELQDRCEELSVSNEMFPITSSVASMLQTAESELLNVNISDYESRLSSLSSDFDAHGAKVLEEMLTSSEDILRKLGAMLDVVDKTLDDLEDDLDEIEEDSDED